MSMKTLRRLRSTEWLAERLGISVATIERLRAQQSPDLPPHVTIGRSIRYDDVTVEEWLRQRMQPAPVLTEATRSESEQDEA